MIMYMCEDEEIPCIAITNRHLVERNYLEQIKRVMKQNPESLILREKDLSAKEYEELAEQVTAMGEKYGIPVFLHFYVDVAKGLGVPNIHVPFWILQKMTREEKNFFQQIGVSVHSVQEAKEAQKLGASRLIAGHIFETSCKPGLPSRGLDFLNSVCENVTIPVYAIGGITHKNARECILAGAKGVCMMSNFMKIGNFINKDVHNPPLFTDTNSTTLK